MEDEVVLVKTPRVSSQLVELGTKVLVVEESLPGLLHDLRRLYAKHVVPRDIQLLIAV